MVGVMRDHPSTREQPIEAQINRMRSLLASLRVILDGAAELDQQSQALGGANLLLDETEKALDELASSPSRKP